MVNFFWQLFDTDGFQDRFHCTSCNSGLLWLHVVSDLSVFGAYCAIPLILMHFVKKRKGKLPFQKLFIFFALFIVSCGLGHAVDAYMWHAPIYRFLAILKVCTAVTSWLTVFVLLKSIPTAIEMRTPDELNEEIERRDLEMLQITKRRRVHQLARHTVQRTWNQFPRHVGRPASVGRLQTFRQLR